MACYLQVVVGCWSLFVIQLWVLVCFVILVAPVVVEAAVVSIVAVTVVVVIVVFFVVVAMLLLLLWLLLVKPCKAKKKENLRNHHGQKHRGTKNRVCVVFAILSSFCNINLHCEDRTSNFAWHVRHMEDRPLHVARYLQDFCK